MHTLLVNVVVLLGLAGFLISFYIYKKKKTKKKLICPRRSNCETVIHSDYSKILGIPVEVLGMIYYFFISSSYIVISIFGFWSSYVSVALVGVSMCSVLFSIYLVSIQMFVLKHWCIWCLSSAFVSILIFILSFLYITTY